MFHLEFPEARVTGASPETLVRARAAVDVEVRPIAGTRPRGSDAEEDERARGRAARRSEGARRAPDADRSRPQRRRPRRRRRAPCSVAEQMVIERYSHVMHLTSHVAASWRAGQDLARRAARGVPGRHAVGRAEDPRHGDHRRARAAPARHLRRRRRLRQLHRQPRSRDRDPHAGRQRRHDLRAGRRRARRRLGARARVPGDASTRRARCCARSRWRARARAGGA